MQHDPSQGLSMSECGHETVVLLEQAQALPCAGLACMVLQASAGKQASYLCSSVQYPGHACDGRLLACFCSQRRPVPTCSAQTYLWLFLGLSSNGLYSFLNPESYNCPSKPKREDLT